MDLKKMNPEVKALWVAALRSGEYEQTTGTLNRQRDDGKHAYCCLGVLCEVAVKAGVIPPARHQYEGSAALYHGYEDPDGCALGVLNGEVLPMAVRDWAGLDNSNPYIAYDSRPLCAAEANDDLNWSFSQIADAIEANL